MTQRDLRLCVVMGGPTGEREISMLTGQAMVNALRHHHFVKPVELLADGRWLLGRGFLSARAPAHGDSESVADGAAPGWCDGRPVAPHEAIARIREESIDVVVNALHGPLGEDGTIQGFFRLHGLPCTGPEATAAAVTMDKRLTKLVLIAAGIETPEFFIVPASVFREGSIPWEEIASRESQRVPFPWVLKPNRLGSSVGVAFVNNWQELLQVGTDLVASWPSSAAGSDLLVEAVVRGRELTCGALEIDGQARALPPIEITPQTSPFFDYRAKYTPGATREVCPAPLTPEAYGAVQSLVVKVHELFGCGPLSRTDLFLTPSGKCVVLEVNTLPGMTETSLIPLSASKEGMTLSDISLHCVDHALERARREGITSAVAIEAGT